MIDSIRVFRDSTIWGFSRSMKKYLCLILILFLGHIASAQTPTPPLEISLKNKDQREEQTKHQLQRLLSTYDLSKWIFTRKILIESGFGVIPHSHPVLTLSTRHLKDDELLLATFIHEQIHWYLEQNPKETEAAIKELNVMFPKVPVGFPDGAKDEASTYLHLLVCYLEYQAVREFLGELRAKQVIQFWTTDHYNWVYKTVLERDRDLGSLIRKQKLLPLKQN